jgi:hypothetical protein
MKTRFLKNSLWLAVIFTAATILGCAEMQSRWDEMRRGKVIETGNPDQEEEITLSSPVVEPGAVARGQKLSYRMTYTLLSPDKEKEFDVVEVITLSGSNLRMELSRKTLKRSQGRHLLALEFAVPPDLPPGPYELVSTIKASGKEKQQACSFTLKR